MCTFRNKLEFGGSNPKKFPYYKATKTDSLCLTYSSGFQTQTSTFCVFLFLGYIWVRTVTMEVIVEDGCRTPRHSECQIPADLACPPAPKKKKVGCVMKQRDPPKNGYFQPPDLEVLFTIAPRREAFAWTLTWFWVSVCVCDSLNSK